MSCSAWGFRTLSELPVAGVVRVVPPVVLLEAVVRGVVDPPEGDRRAEVVAFRGVVVHDVEDHLDARLVHGAHHALELLRLLAELAGRGVLVVRSEEPDRVVAPVVAQALLLQRRVLHELVHGHQLDGGHAELQQVLDDGRVRDAGVGAALLLRDIRMQRREPLHVRLVDHRLRIGRVGVPVARPVEERVDDDGVHHVRVGVVVVARVGVAEVVAEQRLVPVEPPGHRLGIGIEQDLVRIVPVPVLRVVRAVHPVAVPLSRLHLRQVRVPDERVDVLQLDARLSAVLGEQAQLDALGRLAEDGEVRAAAVEGRAERVGGAGPCFHRSSSVVVRTRGRR